MATRLSSTRARAPEPTLITNANDLPSRYRMMVRSGYMSPIIDDDDTGDIFVVFNLGAIRGRVDELFDENGSDGQ